MSINSARRSTCFKYRPNRFIAVRAASALGFNVEGYIDAGVKLRAAGLLSDDELNRYRAAVRFRNIAVHQYGVVDPNVVARIVRNREYRELAKIGLKVYEELKKRGLDP
ncbi:MAG: HepT-like ribonuclease domain-containing protein [Thermoproteus sp.]